MDSNFGLVFIPGAGLNSSIWEELIRELKIPSLSMNFSTIKRDRKTINSLTFEDYVNAGISQIEDWEKDHFIIVAHSIGACIGLKVANHFKKEVRGFIAVGSVIPRSGNSFISSLPFPQNLIMPVVLKLFGTKPPQKSIKNELCNDLSADQTIKIVNEFTQESKALFTAKLSFTLPEVNRLYIKLKNDKSMSEAFQEKMAKNLNPYKILEIDSGHLPMVCKPKQFAQIVSDFVKETQMEENAGRS